MLLSCLEQMSNIYDNVDSILITNRDGIVEYAALLNRDGKSVNNEGYTGMHLLDIYRDLKEEESTIFRVMKTGIPIVDEIQTLTDFNGRRDKFCCSTYPITCGDIVIGAVEGVIYLTEEGGPVNSKIHKRRTADDRQENFYVMDDFVTRDIEMIKEKNKAVQVARGNSPVMIFGETGTGKEIIAEAIHSESGRKGSFIAQNCSAITSSLLESTLFGTVKGGFTGAENRKGILELADGGTLFLDELNSMDISLQGKLLKAVEEGRVRRIGDEKERKIDIRIVSALNIDPFYAIEQGEIREDLFYRLGVVHIKLNPLRDRKNDIPLLIRHFIGEYNRKRNKRIKCCSEIAQNILVEYNWPGNVRELRNAIEYAFNMTQGEKITVKELPEYIVNENRRHETMNIINRMSLTEAVDEYEKKIIQHVINNSSSASEAADKLGITRQTLRYKMKKYCLL